MQTIREVELRDASDILGIYNYYIANSISTFDEEQKTLAYIENKISSISIKYPWYVIEDNRKIIAFAYADQWKDKSAYDKSVESTIYVSNNARGKGLGHKIYKHLIDKLKQDGYHSITGIISLPNDESISLHEKLGFEKVAHFKEIGSKFNMIIDVACWQLIL